MQIAFQSDPEALVRSAWTLLAADQVEHTGLLGVLHNARQAFARGVPFDDRPWCSAVVHDDDRRPLAAGLCGRGGTWLVSSGPDAALALLGSGVARAESVAGAAGGVMGPAAAAHAFASGLGVSMHVHFEQPIMRLAGVPDAGPPVDGDCVVAQPVHQGVLEAWFEAFRVEARLLDPPERIAADVVQAIASGRMLVWRDGDGVPVSMAGARAVAPSAARIGPVYTPPARRGRSYARAVVAEGCRRMLAQGADCVLLFTDAANPTSNALYARIGFVTVARQVHLVKGAAGAA
jgi:ribosomal protein S18 acetylase RimI-like enzyme